jgi:membrane protein implicated in regulation of membrane protease activity
MSRQPRAAPRREEEPLEEFSTWNVRVARIFYYSYVIASAIIVVGVWATLLAALDPKVWEQYLSLELGFQVAIVAGFVTGHLILLVLFYSLFRGGIVKMCRTLYKDRLVAKKWEDFTTLRYLMGITLIGIYITVISLILALVPGGFFKFLGDVWLWAVQNFNVGNWILWTGFVIFMVIVFFFVMFVLWNHGVYVVLRQVKKIEEEEEIDFQIKKENVQKMNEEQRQEEYNKQTGKTAIYRGKQTKDYTHWRKKFGLK